MCCRSSLLAGKGGGGGRGAESYDRKKAWSSHAILSGRGRRQNEIKAERWIGSVRIQLCFWSGGKSQRKSHERGGGMRLGCAVKCKYKRLWSNIFSNRLYFVDLLRGAIFETNRCDFFRSKSKRAKIKRIRSRLALKRTQRHNILFYRKCFDQKKFKFKGLESEDYLGLRQGKKALEKG